MIKVLYKLFRFRPVIAWAVCGILLGLSVAIHTDGLNLNWLYVGIAILPIIFLQSFVSHAINDLEDEDVDKITDLDGTNRYKVLISGIISRNDLMYLSIFFICLSAIATIFLMSKLGSIILLFYYIGLYAALGYSLPPFKLGWRPYSEWTVVFPVLVTLVIAVNYIATGHFSYLSLLIGITFALYNIVWFIVSRMVDYHPDKAIGKRTTIVKHGLDTGKYFIHPYLLYVNLISIGLFAYVSTLLSIPLIFIIICAFLSLRCCPMYYEHYSKKLASCRKNLIYVSILNSIIISLYLL